MKADFLNGGESTPSNVTYNFYNNCTPNDDVGFIELTASENLNKYQLNEVQENSDGTKDTFGYMYEYIKLCKISQSDSMSFTYPKFDKFELLSSFRVGNDYLFYLQNSGEPKMKYLSFPSPKSPYKISTKSNRIYLKADNIRDYKTNKSLGSFSGNIYNVHTLKEGGCGYKVKKDRKGFELINSERDVVFSLDYVSYNNLIFRGYYKIGDTIYVYNGEKIDTTLDINKAKSLIDSIDYLFNHTLEGNIRI